MSEYSDLVTHICSTYRGYMKFARLLKITEKVGKKLHHNPVPWLVFECVCFEPHLSNFDTGKHSNLAKNVEAQEFVFRTLFLIYEMAIKEKIYG